MFLQLKKTILLVLCLSFCAGTLSYGMMIGSPEPRSRYRETPPSSSKKTVKTTVTHHCYKILSAISKSAAEADGQLASAGVRAFFENDKLTEKQYQINRVQDAFREFFAAIPYDMQSIKKKKNDVNNYTEEFYDALFYSLSRCLERCATGESDKETKIKILKGNGEQSGVIYIPLKHDDKVFVLQFCVCDAEQLETREYLHNDESEVSIYVTVLLDGEGKYSRAEVYSQDDVELKVSSSIEINDPIAIDQDEKIKLGKSEDVYANAIDAIISNNDVSFFKELLERDMADLKKVSVSLGLELRPSCEHYHQCLLADILMFVLVGTVTSEVKVYHGRIDIKLNLAGSEIIIFELKYKKSADEALYQIFSRGYGMGDCSLIKKAVGINLTENFDVQVSVFDCANKKISNEKLDRLKSRVRTERFKRRSIKRKKEILVRYLNELKKKKASV